MQNSNMKLHDYELEIEDDIYTLEDMHFYIDRALTFSKGKTYTIFEGDLELKFAIAYAISQIGIEASSLSDTFVKKHALLLNDIITLGESLAKNYFIMSEYSLWSAIKSDLPLLFEQCTQILKDANRVL